MCRDHLNTNQQYSIWIVIYSLLIIIGSCFGYYYYQEYIKPESYTIGSITMYDYVPAGLKDHYSEDDILFAQDISNSAFKIENGIATYKYQFGPINFDSTSNYLIYVNEKPIGSLKQASHTISGILEKSFYNNVDSLLSEGDVSIKFSAQSKNTTLEVSINQDVYPYLKSFFTVNNCTITLAKTEYGIYDVIDTVPVAISTLTIDFEDDKNIDRTITGYPGMKYTINRLESDNYIFIGYELQSGDGDLVGNVYTFGLENAVIKAKSTTKVQEITLTNVASQYVNGQYKYEFETYGHEITLLGCHLNAVDVEVDGIVNTYSLSSTLSINRDRPTIYLLKPTSNIRFEHTVTLTPEYILLEFVPESPQNGWIESITISYEIEE